MKLIRVDKTIIIEVDKVFVVVAQDDTYFRPFLIEVDHSRTWVGIIIVDEDSESGLHPDGITTVPWRQVDQTAQQHRIFYLPDSKP